MLNKRWPVNFNPSSPCGSDGKEVTCNVGDPWVGKIPWRGAWQPTPVLLSAESPWTEEPGRLQSMGPQSQTGLRAKDSAALVLGYTDPDAETGGRS